MFKCIGTHPVDVSFFFCGKRAEYIGIQPEVLHIASIYIINNSMRYKIINMVQFLAILVTLCYDSDQFIIVTV